MTTRASRAAWRRQEKPFRMGVTATSLDEPKQTSRPPGRVHRTMAGSSPQTGCAQTPVQRCHLAQRLWCLSQSCKPYRAHHGLLQRARKASAMPTPLWTLVAPWYQPKSLLPLSSTPDNEVQCICDLFCLLCILTEIHCPAAWVMYWQLNKGLHFCWLTVTSSSTSNQQSYISLAWLEIWQKMSNRGKKIHEKYTAINQSFVW